MYSALDHSKSEVRLLEVFPCENGQTAVRCQLTVSSLLEKPRYWALSYVWGDASITEEVIVGGLPLQVTANLASALRRFRRMGAGHDINSPSPSPSLLIWADAICINQNDVAEKEHQVPLMAGIYAQATVVMSWLGERGSDHIDLAFELISDYATYLDSQQREADQARCKTDEEPVSTEELEWIRMKPKYYQADTAVDNRNTTWNAVMALADHVYWTRVWVVQELELALSAEKRLLVYGEHSILFSQFEDFQVFMIRLQEQTPVPPQNFIDEYVWEKMVTRAQFTMGEVVFRSQGFKQRAAEGKWLDCRFVILIAMTCHCFLPQDYIYGLYTLLGVDVRPNYSKPVVEVYLDWFAMALDRSGSDTKNLLASSVGVTREAGWPSWLPRLYTLAADYVRTVKERYIPPKAWLDQLQLSGPIMTEHRILQIQGVRLDQIVDVFHFELTEPQGEIFAEVFWRFCLRFVATCGIGRTAAGLLPLEALFVAIMQREFAKLGVVAARSDPEYIYAEAFQILLAMGKPSAETDESIQILGFNDTEAAHEHLLTSFSDRPIRDLSETGDERAWFACRRLMFRIFDMSSRSLFRTENGHIGMGHADTAPGDVICLLETCTLPTVLRVACSEWEIVGSCYVHGFSDGEPVTTIMNEGVTLDIFRLR
ncbi:heterokaryon incompatibility protein-domain-containing protein [Xylariaceae sp. AK1471]|nr:heterokaryon incompatibility protein-domain-containing protein [Xylariaceae sp. AK1471]